MKNNNTDTVTPREILKNDHIRKIADSIFLFEGSGILSELKVDLFFSLLKSKRNELLESSHLVVITLWKLAIERYQVL